MIQTRASETKVSQAKKLINDMIVSGLATARINTQNGTIEIKMERNKK